MFEKLSSSRAFIFLYLLYLALSLPVSIANLRYGCLPAYDLGIFSEILSKAWVFEWDPFITTRESFLLQDHWDPVTLLLGYLTFPLRGLISAPIFLIWFETSLVFATAVFVFRALKKRNFPAQRAWLGFAIILFARVVWNALSFPVHPATWALLPHVGFAVWTYDFFQNQRSWEIRKLLFWFLLIWICGEQFSLSIVTASFALLIFSSRRRKSLGAVFLLALALAWWAMSGRIYVHGSIYDHTSRLVLDPMKVLAMYEFDITFFRRFVEGMLPFFAPVALVLLELNKTRSLPWLEKLKSSGLLLVSAAFFLPLFAGRLLSNSWRFHYGIPICGFFIACLFLQRQKIWGQRLVLTFLFLIFIGSISDWTRPLKMAASPAPGCSAENGTASSAEWDQRSLDLSEAVSIMSKGARVLAGSYLVPTLQDQRSDLILHTLGPFKQVDLVAPIDYLIVSRGRFDNQWPLQSEQVAQILSMLGSLKIHQMETLTLVQGPMTPDLFQEFEGVQNFKKLER